MQTYKRPLQESPRLLRPAFKVLAFALVGIVGLMNPPKADADGSVLVSAVSGLLSRTNYRSLPAGTDSYGYWGEQAVAPDRVQYVADPTGQRGIVQRIEVQPGDKSGEGDRAEVMNSYDLAGFRDGETLVMSWGLMIDETFASPPGTWNSFVQIHDGGGNQAPVFLSLASDRADLVLHLFGGGKWVPLGQPEGTVGETLELGLLPKNRWNDFVMAVRFGCEGSGYVQLWLNGQTLVDARDRKIGYCGDPGMYWKQGFYRSAYDQTTRLWFSDTFRWATVRDAANFYRSRI